MSVSERFLKYVSFGTNSDEESESCPSSASQKVLGEYLAAELKEIGLSGVEMDKDGYVYGYIPATKGFENKKTVGFIAHMDTSPDVCGDNIKPRQFLYEGGDIKLNDSVTTKVKDFPFLEKYKGQTLIVTDGTTLLGADDKAGVAEIFEACDRIIKSDIPHGKIPVCITPDEEIGRGADRFDIKRFGADWAYTIDGGELGEIEYENFNAASAKITVHGVNIHPGSAKDKMKNASLMAINFVNMLPANETPSHTEGYEGFYHLNSISGDETLAKMNFIIRDHDMEKFLARKKFFKDAVDYLNGVYGEGTFELAMRDSYYNMREKILPHMHIIDSAKKAMTDAGVTPLVVAIRGGTDGARLSFEGLPCPNLSVGGGNFHGIHEFVSVDAMEKMVEVIINLVKEQAE